MAIPSSYSEIQLSDYMLTVTAQISTVIGLTSDSFDEAVNDTLVAYGVDGIASVTDINKLRTLARVEAWRTVVNATAGEHDHSSDSGETSVYFKRNQLHENAKAQLLASEAQAERLGYVVNSASYNMVTFGTVVYDDPYAITEDGE
jgi:hypothetical protein